VILIASDHAGPELKGRLTALLEARGYAHRDLGVFSEESVDYPDLAHQVASGVAGGEATMGILVCGTGIGMSMAANRHRGVRAALCHDVFTAEMARRHNDANLLCLGARVLDPATAERIVEVFLTTAFEGGRHQRRIDKIELSVSGEE
jgi:ribose 5-phosphate isomerase B